MPRLSGVYDIRKFMDGDYDDNFYFNNPVDYVASLHDPWYLHHLARTTSASPPATAPTRIRGRPTASPRSSPKGIPHSVDDWGADGGHDWPYWKNMMNDYLSRLPF